MSLGRESVRALGRSRQSPVSRTSAPGDERLGFASSALPAPADLEGLPDLGAWRTPGEPQQNIKPRRTQRP